MMEEFALARGSAHLARAMRRRLLAMTPSSSIIHPERRKVRAGLAGTVTHFFPGAKLCFSGAEEKGHLQAFPLAREEGAPPFLSMPYFQVAMQKMLVRVHIMVDSVAKLLSRLPMFHPGHPLRLRSRFALIPSQPYCVPWRG